MFSSRTNWHREPNRLTELLASCRKNNKLIYDLTASNPTECGFSYPEQQFLSALANPQTLHYQPDSQGLLSAREVIARYYHEKNIRVDASQIFLTASTSEAYSLLAKLLCNVNERVLVPRPSYPLFEYLGEINDVQLDFYHINYDHGWSIDIDSVRRAITSSTKAIVIVNPHNPTGMFLKNDEYGRIREIARLHNLAIIVDEVFVDYLFQPDPHRLGTTAGGTDVLTFTLNGISKMIGLPQMKLAWIVVNGEPSGVKEATGRLEILCDTFLSVNTPVQVALPTFFEFRQTVQREILNRITSNYNSLDSLLRNSPCSLLGAEGGWYAILQIPKTKSEEEWAVGLLNECGIYLFPGYFFDFHNEGYLVVSLLTPPEVLGVAVKNLVHYISC